MEEFLSDLSRARDQGSGRLVSVAFLPASAILSFGGTPWLAVPGLLFFVCDTAFFMMNAQKPLFFWAGGSLFLFWPLVYLGRVGKPAVINQVRLSSGSWFQSKNL